MEHLFADGSLSFTGQDVECIPPWLSKKYGEHTIRVDLSFNRLRSIKGLAGFEHVKEVVLDNNQISDDVELPQLDNVETLTLNKNNLTNLESFIEQVGEKLPKLSYLSLLGNEACPNQLSNCQHDENDYKRYRYYILSCLPRLKFLDSTPVSKEEREEAARIGQFMRVIRVDGSTESEASESKEKDIYSPLPSSTGKEGCHRSSFGKCRYVYYGKHSEGNRFIGNNLL